MLYNSQLSHAIACSQILCSAGQIRIRQDLNMYLEMVGWEVNMNSLCCSSDVKLIRSTDLLESCKEFSNIDNWIRCPMLIISAKKFCQHLTLSHAKIKVRRVPTRKCINNEQYIFSGRTLLSTCKFKLIIVIVRQGSSLNDLHSL